MQDLVALRQTDLFGANIHESAAVPPCLLPNVNPALPLLPFEQLRPGTPVVSRGFDAGE